MNCTNVMVSKAVTYTGQQIQYRWPCGQCLACRIRKRKEWVLRMMLEAREANYVYFCTLTYRDERLWPDGVRKAELQSFIRKMRKHFPAGTLRYFGVGEYGEDKGRPHYHVLFFSRLPFRLFIDRVIPSRPVQTAVEVVGSWYGDCRTECLPIVESGDLGPVCRYVASYVVKKMTTPEACERAGCSTWNPEFCLMSRKPGIGLHGETVRRLVAGIRPEDDRPIQMVHFEGDLWPLSRSLKDKMKAELGPRAPSPARLVYSIESEFKDRIGATEYKALTELRRGKEAKQKARYQITRSAKSKAYKGIDVSKDEANVE